LYHTQRFWYSEHKVNDNIDKYFLPAPFDKEFHLILNVAVGGPKSSYTGFQQPDKARIESVSQVLEVDWVRVFDMKDIAESTTEECGDRSCDAGDPTRCAEDCQYMWPNPKCGDRVCDTGEDPATCQIDCTA
jgi:hypothetical protein